MDMLILEVDLPVIPATFMLTSPPSKSPGPPQLSHAEVRVLGPVQRLSLMGETGGPSVNPSC